MVRTRRGNVAAKRRKKNLKLAKGFVGSQSKLATLAGEQVVQSLNFAYVGRRLKKRNFRRIWIYRINAASRARKNIYSQFIGCLRSLNIFLDRKSLSTIAFTDLSSFNVIERESRKSPIFKK
jgi:large subunit ribosomal protein L20|tara:strand:+ start:35 stop:400 length:366 start_codon:yes stop_codon:yes gene_type:complete